MDFGGKVVIVTGAGSGIGRAIAQEYGSNGANVVIAEINDEAGRNTEELIKSSGGEAYFIHTDVSQPDDIQLMVKKTIEKYGRIDIVVNNAGVSRWQSLYELAVAEWDEIINTNLRSVFICTREAAKYMKNQGGGAVVNLASTRAIMSEPNTEAYAATKGGILALTHALAISLGPDNIRVNAISPGWIETGKYEDLRPIDHLQHPSQRVGRPGDVARLCLFLTSDVNGFITGENIVVDGGMTRKMIYEE